MPSLASVARAASGSLSSMEAVKSGPAAMPTRAAILSWPCERHEQRDPAAHGGADQNERPFGEVVDQEQRVARPFADRALLEPAAAGAVAAVIEPEAGVALLFAKGCQAGRLVAGHVAHEAGEEDQRGGTAWGEVVG